MIIFLIVIFFLIGVSLGGYLQKRLTKRAFKIEQEKAAEEKKNKFIELVSKLKNGKSKFKSRINDDMKRKQTWLRKGGSGFNSKLKKMIS